MRQRSSEQEDYLLRMIRELAGLARRLRERLRGKADASVAVREEASAAIGRLLGRESGLLERLDAPTAVRLVGSTQAVALWTELLECEAEALEAEGRVDDAAVRRRRAQALRDALAQQES